MLTRTIHERWPGVNFRIACTRYLAEHPEHLFRLANEVSVVPKEFKSWLKGNTTYHILGLSSETLKTLEKYNNSKKNKKRGRPAREFDGHLVQRIKDYGVTEYVEKILSERRSAVPTAARVRSIT